MALSLKYIDRFNIVNEDEGLKEPSGLSLTHDQKALWTVSDDTKMIFKIDLQGRLIEDESFKVSVKGLEGIAIDPSGKLLYGVKEATKKSRNEIVKIEINEKKVARVVLNDIGNFDEIAELFLDEEKDKEKGLEGIDWNATTDTIFVVKEGIPGLLIEIAADLATIKNYRVLGRDNGFYDDDLHHKKIDFSGLCYDQGRQSFWIVSDKAKRLFLYDWEANKVTQSLALEYSLDGEPKRIKKAEGVAFDPNSNRLYIVDDKKKAKLYVFEVQEA